MNITIDGDELYSTIIHAECASKSNSRRLIFNKKTKRPMFIKNEKALIFEQEFSKQALPVDAIITDDILLYAKIFYKTRRNDLDESLVMDCLQNSRIIKNDRQIKGKFILHGISKECPRVEIKLYRYDFITCA